MNPTSSKADALVREKSQKKIRAMFDEIAPTYDFLNHFLSGGTDIYWRWQTVRKVKANLPSRTAPKILDVATGTGDLAVMLSRVPNAEVVGIDLSDEMLKRARLKKPNIRFELGEAESLKFSNETFEAVTAGFGARNFEDLQQGLNEFYRILKPNGVAAILEPMIPRNGIVKNFYQWYFKNVLPKMASLFTKSDFAYDYLPRSVAMFPQGEDFLTYLKRAGFREACFYTMTFETAILYIAKK
jgi:demethylmenaquinone methyltransferase/2-methoxy-6-polyprenyl-1,4-benzoquinol methylase